MVPCMGFRLFDESVSILIKIIPCLHKFFIKNYIKKVIHKIGTSKAYRPKMSSFLIILITARIT